MTTTDPSRTGLRLRPYLVVGRRRRRHRLLRRGVRRPRRGRPHPRRRRSRRPQRARDRRQRLLPRRRLPRVRHPGARSRRSACRLHLEVADADATVARAAAAGATVLQPVEDRFYGSRSGTVRDPFGHQWQIDAPGTVSTTPAERDQEMADGGYRYETVDLGERAPADPPTRTEVAAASADAPGVGYFTIDAPDPARAAAFFGALLGWDARPERRGLPHRERRRRPAASTARPPSPASPSSSGWPTSRAAAARVRELGGTVLDEAVHPSGGNARCLDDQGVPFQLWQPAPGY